MAVGFTVERCRELRKALPGADSKEGVVPKISAFGLGSPDIPMHSDDIVLKNLRISLGSANG